MEILVKMWLGQNSPADSGLNLAKFAIQCFLMVLSSLDPTEQESERWPPASVERFEKFA